MEKKLRDIQEIMKQQYQSYRDNLMMTFYKRNKILVLLFVICIYPWKNKK